MRNINIRLAVSLHSVLHLVAKIVSSNEVVILDKQPLVELHPDPFDIVVTEASNDVESECQFDWRFIDCCCIRWLSQYPSLDIVDSVFNWRCAIQVVLRRML